MRHTAFVAFLAQIEQLTPAQRKRLLEHLKGRGSAAAPCAVVPLPAAHGCPIAEPQLIAWGHEVKAMGSSATAAESAGEPSMR